MKKIHYKISTYSKKLDKQILEDGIRLGCKMWTDSTGLEFKQVNNNQDITMQFLPEWWVSNYQMFQGGVSGYTTKNRDMIIFNDRIYYSINAENQVITNEIGQRRMIKTTNLPVLTAHELGHVWGLKHTTDPNDVMCDYNNEQSKLSENDINQMLGVIYCTV